MPWKGIATGVAAVAAATYTVYKVYRFEDKLARIELQQKGIELLQAHEAVIGVTLGPPVVTEVRGTVTDALSRTATKGRASPFLLVRVPVTFKNHSRLPIAVDFVEQWVFVGQMLGPRSGRHAEVLNSSSDVYPVAWHRTHCTVGVSWGVLSNLGLAGSLLAQGKAELLGRQGVRYWARGGGVSMENDLLLLAEPGTDEAQAQYAKLKLILGRRIYFDHSEFGEACSAVTDSILWTGTLRGGEETAGTASYVVRSTDGWFSHFVRIDYRQQREAGAPGECSTALQKGVQSLFENLQLDLEFCIPAKKPSVDDYRYLDKRQVIYLPAVLQAQKRAEARK